MTTAEPSAMRYPDLDTLSRSSSAGIAANLRAAISARGQASLVVSGGRSPVTLFDSLREQPLDWSRVCVTLADERWVAPSDPSSNERLVRENLLQGLAAAARFTSLKNAAATPALGAAEAWQAIAAMPRPFDVVLLGMGDDGHTASLFPHSPNLAEGLDVSAAPGCLALTAPAPPTERISLNLAALLNSRRILVIITGESKWHTYIAASQAGPAELMPVRAVLRQHQTPVNVIWAP